MGHQLRKATLEDVPRLEALIQLSARTLGAADYRTEQIERALLGPFGVDTQLVRDGTYFQVETGNALSGCGGWSRRRTLFGGDARPGRDASELDPKVEAAKIRAFFVHPRFARQGVGTLILERCEHDAAAWGFTRAELMATLPGVRLYAERGYAAAGAIDWPLDEDGLKIKFVPMVKTFSPTTAGSPA